MKNTAKRISVLIFVVLLTALTLCSCSKSLKDQLGGEWQIEEEEGSYLVLNRNGTGKIVILGDGELDINWTVENDNKLVIVAPRNNEYSNIYDMTLEGDRLTLALGNRGSFRLRKKK